MPIIPPADDDLSHSEITVPNDPSPTPDSVSGASSASEQQQASSEGALPRRHIEQGNSSSEHIRPARFVYTGPLAESATAREVWEDYIVHGRGTAFRHEVRTPATHALSTRLIDAAQRVGETLGVRLIMPLENEMHYFDDTEYYNDAAASVVGHDVASQTIGIQHPAVGMLMLMPENDEPALASNTGHELAHDVGQVIVTLDITEIDGNAIATWTDLQEGYIGDPEAPHSSLGTGANEAAAEALMHMIVREAGYNEVVYQYGPILALSRGVIDSVAQRQGKSSQEIITAFTTGRLTGDHGVLHDFEAVLGHERMQTYMTLTGTEPLADIITLAREWDLPIAQRLLEDIQTGRQFKPLE